MQYKKICFNGFATFGLFSLAFFLYSFNNGIGTFMIQSRTFASSLAVSALTKSSTSSTLSSIASSSSSSSSAAPVKRQLLLVTKGRSGSSFTSSLVRNDQEVFYTFEPLYVLQTKVDSQNIGMMNYINMDNKRKRAYAVLKAFLECDFSEVTGEDMDNYQIRMSSTMASEFLHCVRSKDHGSRHLTCLFKIMKECKSKSVAFAKVIRFPMAWAEQLLQQMPTLKILYLIRDPRAVLHSQSRVFRNFKWPSEVEPAAKNLCTQLEEDIEALERLETVFPGRVHVIKYEHGATHSMSYAKDIYNFARLNFTERTAEYLDSLKGAENNTHPGQNAYSLYRSNATRTMNGWRYRSGFNAIKVVDQICSKVYEKMGYRPVTSQRDLESDRQLFDLDMAFTKVLPAS